jgi:hypothetical protein
MSSASKPRQAGSRWNTTEVQSFLEGLVTTWPHIAQECTDDERTFSYNVTPSSPHEATSWLGSLSPHAGKCDIQLSCTLAEGLRGRFSLGSGNELRADGPLELDEDLYLRPEEESLARIVDDLVDRLSPRRATIDLADLDQALSALHHGGVRVRLEIALAVNKRAWQDQLLGEDPGANTALFFFPCQFLAFLARKTLSELERAWYAVPDRPLILVVLQAQGYLEGDYLACFGLDALAEVASYRARAHDFERLSRLRHLRDQQCIWDGKPGVLAPDHFILQSRGFRGDCAAGIEAELRAIAAQLAAGYLADRTEGRAEPPTSRFDGYRTCQVFVDRQTWRDLVRGQGLAAGPWLALYRWAYENYSGDQLGVVRQLISLELDKGPEGNARRLLEGAAKILETARVNLQQLVRRNIGEYFVARNQVCEFLRKYTDEISATLSDMTGELIGNLYKTLAAIIAAIVAADLTQQADLVIVTTAGLYALYVGFIVVYLLPSVWTRFHLKRGEYRNNVRQFVKKDVLLQEEIDRFQGQSYARSERLFYGYFVVTLLIYLLLGGIAFVVAEFFGLRLLA